MPESYHATSETSTPTVAALAAEMRCTRGYDRRRAIHARLEILSAHLRSLLPFATKTAYAYSPRESARSGGGIHLVVVDPIKIGRIARSPGETLCKGAFWGLVAWDKPMDRADCLKCLAVAERFAKHAESEAAE